MFFGWFRKKREEPKVSSAGECIPVYGWYEVSDSAGRVVETGGFNSSGGFTPDSGSSGNDESLIVVLSWGHDLPRSIRRRR